MLYTNDNEGSYDFKMPSQRLARIRKREEEDAALAVLGTPKENILWMGYDDGMLEYAPQPNLVGETTAVIRRIRPNVVLSVDLANGLCDGIRLTTAWQRSIRLTLSAPRPARSAAALF